MAIFPLPLLLHLLILLVLPLSQSAILDEIATLRADLYAKFWTHNTTISYPKRW